MNKALLDLYADYLISSFGPTTATGLSALVSGAVSHDAITRLLSNGGQAFTSRELWQLVKPLARQAQSQDAVLIVDDTIQEKPHTDENDLICWHFDHTQQKTVKGFNLLTCLYFSQEVSLPLAFELIQKTQRIVDASWMPRPDKKKESLLTPRTSCIAKCFKPAAIMLCLFAPCSMTCGLPAPKICAGSKARCKKSS
jgi:hypothetical protein